jgi:hypothetical protein
VLSHLFWPIQLLQRPSCRRFAALTSLSTFDYKIANEQSLYFKAKINEQSLDFNEIASNLYLSIIKERSSIAQVVY